jgi:hypothetical protein
MFEWWHKFLYDTDTFVATLFILAILLGFGGWMLYEIIDTKKREKAHNEMFRKGIQ